MLKFRGEAVASAGNEPYHKRRTGGTNAPTCSEPCSKMTADVNSCTDRFASQHDPPGLAARPELIIAIPQSEPPPKKRTQLFGKSFGTASSVERHNANTRLTTLPTSPHS